jgi:3-oxoadipate enol-lactonase
MAPTLILLHGIGGNAAGFAPVVEAFAARGLRARAWSQPGYDGTPLIEPYDFEACARSLGAWLDQQRLGAVVLAGHSMGGMIAQTLWRQTTQHQATDDRGWRIAGLVLAHTSPAFGSPSGDFQRQFVESRTQPLDEGRTMREIGSRLAPTLMAPGTPAAVVERGIAMMAAVPPETYRKAVAAITRFDGRAALSGITVPTLCLAAEHDKTSSPEVLSRMATKIPGADYECLTGLGHLAPIENPARWADTIGAWCARRLA